MKTSIYDPLGLVSSVTVERKQFYRSAVDEKKGWGSEVSKELKEKWIKWLNSKSRIARRGLSIARKELIACHIEIKRGPTLQRTQTGH